MPGEASTDVFLKKFSQNIAIDQDGIMYGKMKTTETNFLNGILDLVISQANIPPDKTAIVQASNDIKTEFPKGVQNFSAE
ncbi:unknown [Firmicutes bacterium CAG:449]|nr:unknown [Firmicutes bacterium CAG:449]